MVKRGEWAVKSQFTRKFSVKNLFAYLLSWLAPREKKIYLPVVSCTHIWLARLYGMQVSYGAKQWALDRVGAAKRSKQGSNTSEWNCQGLQSLSSYPWSQTVSEVDI